MKPLNQIERKQVFWKFMGLNSLVILLIAAVFGTGFLYVPEKANKAAIAQFDIQTYMAEEMSALDSILKKMNTEEEDGKWNDLLFSATKLLDKWKSDDKLKNSSLAQSIVSASVDRRTDKQTIKKMKKETIVLKNRIKTLEQQLTESGETPPGGGPADNTELLKCHQDVTNLKNDLERSNQRIQSARDYARRIEANYKEANDIVSRLKRNAFPGKDGNKKEVLKDRLNKIKDNALRIQNQ